MKSLEESARDDNDARSEVSRAESQKPFKKKLNSAKGNRDKSTPGKPIQKIASPTQAISSKELYEREKK